MKTYNRFLAIALAAAMLFAACDPDMLVPEPEPEPPEIPAEPDPEPKIEVTGVTLDAESLMIFTDLTDTLTVTVLPADATDRTVKWGSTNPAIATVDDSGIVSPLAPGTTILTVTSIDGLHTAACIVNVKSRPVITIQNIRRFTMYSNTTYNHMAEVIASVTGDEKLSYQWYEYAKESDEEPTPIKYATSSTHTIDGGFLGQPQLPRYNFYFCIVSATGGAIPVSTPFL